MCLEYSFIFVLASSISFNKGKGSKNRALVTHNCVFHPHLAYASYVIGIFFIYVNRSCLVHAASFCPACFNQLHPDKEAIKERAHWFETKHDVRLFLLAFLFYKNFKHKNMEPPTQIRTIVAWPVMLCIEFICSIMCRSIPRSISLEEIEAIDKEEEQSDRDIEQHDEVFYDSDDIENPKSTHCNGEVSIEHNESTLPSLLGEWFPYSRLSAVGTTSKRSLACAPSIATGLLVGFRKMFGLCFEKRDKRYSRRDTWRID